MGCRALAFLARVRIFRLRGEPEGLTEIVYGSVALLVSKTVCGESGALSVITIRAVRWPAASGANVTARMQLPATGTGAVQPLLTLKSCGLGPDSSTLEISSVVLPAFVTVTFCGLEAGG